MTIPPIVSGACTLVAGVLMLAPGAAAEILVVGRDAPDLHRAVQAASPGDIVEVPSGVWQGPLVVDRAITLRGRGGVIDGGGTGTVVTLKAAGAVVESLEIRGSGNDLSGPDACIYLEPEAVGAVLRGNHLSDCAFGIWVHQTPRARLLGNVVVGRAHVRSADRGNGIHLFDASELEVRDNTVRGARDGIYVSATEDSLIEGNRVEGQRYGIHYMYSYRNTLRGNVARHNLGGLALMQSHGLVVEDNRAEDNERHGLLFRDARDCVIRRNVLRRNGQGMFFFSSTDNRIEGNLVAHNTMGAKVWAGSVRNRVRDNAFVGNRQQVFYVGAADLVWSDAGRGNFWSDYMGWDQDGDGTGDRPHRVDSFTGHLVYRYPTAVLLLRSPVLELLSHLEATVPLFRTATVTDDAPVMRRPEAP
jgi:nitrous oxidase accessory protein